MRRILRNNRGQIVLALAILMSIVILSTVFSIYQMNMGRQLLKYEPVKEIVLAVTSDLERALTVALRNATILFKANNSNYASTGKEVVQDWMQSAVSAYSHLGAKIVIAENTPIFIIDWDSIFGQSSAYADFNMDVEAYGFKGWRGRSIKAVHLRIWSETIQNISENEVTLIFNLRVNTKPVQELTRKLVNVSCSLVNQTYSQDIASNITYLKYLGDGDYRMNFNFSTQEIENSRNQSLSIRLWVKTPKDNIIVSARHIIPISGAENLLQEEGWRTLYVGLPANSSIAEGSESKFMLLPEHYLPPGWYNKEDKVETPFSRGMRKQICNLSSPVAEQFRLPEDLTVNSYVNITLWMSVNPSKNCKNVSATLLFHAPNGIIYTIGSGVKPYSGDTCYTFTINWSGKIDANSVIILMVTVDFTAPQPHGTLFLEFGGNKQSNVHFN